MRVFLSHHGIFLEMEDGDQDGRQILKPHWFKQYLFCNNHTFWHLQTYKYRIKVKANGLYGTSFLCGLSIAMKC